MTLNEKLLRVIRDIPDFPKPGIIFKDITPIFLDPELVRETVAALAAPYRQMGVTKVVGIESRGFLMGTLLAQELNAGFVLVRKKGKLPAATQEVTYDLEYGTATIEIHSDSIHPEDVVLIHDDLLATGGTAVAAARLVSMQMAQIAGYCFLAELKFLRGREVLQTQSHTITSIIQYA